MPAPLFQWNRPLESLGFQFQHARPFRHLVLDGVLPEPFVDRVIETFPREAEMERHVRDARDDKYIATDLRRLAAAFQELKESIQSDLFLEELSTMTGIPNLIPDPFDPEGGVHLGVDGSFIDIHTDPNYVEEKKLYRRLSLIFYFNRGWRREWGGALEMWNTAKSRAEATIDPLANRAVLFETSTTSFHGYRRIQLPSGGSVGPRRSYQVFYYTAERPEHVELTSQRVYRQWDEGDPLHEKLEHRGYLSTIRSLLAPGRRSA